MKKRTVLKDIADYVGVSVASVSYVLNNQEEEKRVGKELSEKIRKAAKKLNYHPNQIAKSLKTNKTHTIGLIVASINYRFTTRITSSIEAEARKNKYTVIFGSSDEDPQKFSDLIDVLINRQVEGLILVAVQQSQEKIKEIKKRGIPFILIDRIFPEIKTNYIGIDNFKAAYQSISHLIETGHKHISFINYKTSFYHLNERNLGYRQALKDHKLTAKKHFLKEIKNRDDIQEVKTAIEELVNDTPACDAILFATGALAISGLKVINDMQLTVPENLAVMSFDESEAFDIFYCPISHARQPLEDMGTKAVEMLMHVIDDKNFCKQVFLESKIVLGRSCGEN